jgi:hypothetical protein
MPKKKKYLSEKELQQALFLRTEGYAANVRTIYQDAFTQIIDIVKGTYLIDGKPFSFAEYGYTDEVQPILRRMYSQTYQTIRGGIQTEWMLAAENNDELVKSIFGEQSISDPHFAKYFLRNKEAMDAFFARKKEGLNLSQNVWKYTGQFKGELENTLDLAIGEGTPANQLAARVKEYLNDPDRWYRRFRIKIGEDEDGNPIYGRKWKRRIFNQEDGIYQWIDDDPRDYHPGRGVYRSSARNAQRLARTETNIAYRASDYERWAQLDFVVGIEIKVSKNHPDPDICDDLQGKYPKDFKWTGWHPNCRCYMIPVLATEDEAFDIADKLASEDDPGSVHSENTVDDVPDGFKKWIQDPKTQERMEKARERGTLPYWVRDNEKYVAGGAVLKSASTKEDTKSTEQGAREELMGERKREYHRLSADTNYRGVEFDESTLGLKATHKDHKTHENDDKRYFAEQLTGDQLEAEFQRLAFEQGHSVIFRPEAENIVDLDMILDGVIMDLLSVTENSTTFSNQLGRKNRQLRKFNSLHSETHNSVCLYFHDPSYYSYEKVEDGLNKLRGYGADVIIKHVFILLNNGSDIIRLSFP